jgi:hypothetical protein
MQLIYASWLGAPRDLAASIVVRLALSMAVAVAWVALWALLSRVMQGEWRWFRHAAIFLCAAAMFSAVTGMVDLGWFVFALPPWSDRNTWIGAVALGCALYLHLTRASSLPGGRAAQIACILAVLLAGGSQWLQDRYRMRNVNYIGDPEHIYPPSLRLRAADAVEDYFKSIEALRDAADGKLAKARVNDTGDDDK